MEVRAINIKLLGESASNALVLVNLELKHFTLSLRHRTEKFSYKKVKYSRHGGGVVNFQSDGLKMDLGGPADSVGLIMKAIDEMSYQPTVDAKKQNNNQLHEVTEQKKINTNSGKVSQKSRSTGTSISSAPLADKCSISKTDKSPGRHMVSVGTDHGENASRDTRCEPTKSVSICQAPVPSSSSSGWTSIPPAPSPAVPILLTSTSSVDKDAWFYDEENSLSLSERPDTAAAKQSAGVRKSYEAVPGFRALPITPAARKVYGTKSRFSTATLLLQNTSLTTPLVAPSDNRGPVSNSSSSRVDSNNIWGLNKDTVASPAVARPSLAVSPAARLLLSLEPKKQADIVTDGSSSSKVSSDSTAVRQATRPAGSSWFSAFIVPADKRTFDVPSATAVTSVTARIPGGIRNMGNTCYIAATLQAILPLATDWLLSPFWTSLVRSQQEPHTVDAPETEAGSAVVAKYNTFSPLRELQNLAKARQDFLAAKPSVSTYSTSASRLLDVSLLKRAVCYHTKKYMGYSQQDAHEFLADLSDLLDCEMLVRFQALQLHLSMSGRAGSAGAPEVNAPASPPLQDQSVRCKSFSIESASKSALKRRHDELAQGDPAQLTAKKRRAIHAETFDSLEEAEGRGDEVCGVAVFTPLMPMTSLLQSTVCMSIQCLKCGHAHEPRHEVYQHLPLDLPSADQSSPPLTFSPSQTPRSHLQLRSLVGEFFREESRELLCESCAGNEDPSAMRSVAGMVRIHSRWSQPPQVLVLQLKRFQYDYATSTFTKVSAAVAFPVQLDLSEFVQQQLGQQLGQQHGSGIAYEHGTDTGSSPGNGTGPACWASSVQEVENDPTLVYRLGAESSGGAAQINCAKYELSAVVRHIGSTEGAGHYICDVRGGGSDSSNSSPSGGSGPTKQEWRRFDDSVVSVIAEKQVMEEERTPYLFFYTRAF